MTSRSRSIRILLVLAALQAFVTGGLLSSDVAAQLPVASDSTASFQVLAYHDVRDDVAGELDSDRYAVSTSQLIEHFEWLRENGYTPVQVDDLLAARSGERPLPPRAVLLTFDDGLRSAYTRVFPLLRLYGYPAVVSVVGSWLDAPEDWRQNYNGRAVLTRDSLVSWEELRTMQVSGLVEVATHTWNLHRGLPGNPFGNEQPAAVARTWDPASGAYEPDSGYVRRIRDDLERAASRIEEELGTRPRVVSWPYGEYSRITQEIAREAGIQISLGLRPGEQRVEELATVSRLPVTGNPSVRDLAWLMSESGAAVSPVRVVHVDLDYVFDPDPEQAERNLDHLLERIRSLRPTTVYLQAFADPDGDGTASELYFPNRHLPVRADLFNRVAWQLRTRVGVEVFAWMPVLAFDLPDPARNEALSVKRWDGSRAVSSRTDYRRLSPWEPMARSVIREIYEDLGKSAFFDGILFHDDGYLNDREDASAYPREPGRLPSAGEKTQALLDLTDALADEVRRYRPAIRTARNLYARVVLEPAAEAWFAQNLARSLERYDRVAVMAMPYMEGARNPERWLNRLVERVAAVPGGLDRTVFELQSVDWRADRRVPSERVARWMRTLESRGAIHFGYYPDDFIGGFPALETIRTALSVEHYPWARR